MIRRNLLRAGAAWTLIAVAGVSVCALTVVLRNDKPIEASHLPKEIVSAANAQRRVYGYSGDGDMTLCFEGATKDLNKFLKDLSGAKNTSLHAVFMTDKGVSRKLSFVSSLPTGQDRDLVRFDWKLQVEKPLRFGPASQPAEQATPWLVTVVISLAGKVRLDEVELPLAYDAHCGGRLGEFVEAHNGRRAQFDKPAASRPSSQPTTMGILKDRNLFGTRRP